MGKQQSKKADLRCLFDAIALLAHHSPTRSNITSYINCSLRNCLKKSTNISWTSLRGLRLRQGRSRHRYSKTIIQQVLQVDNNVFLSAILRTLIINAVTPTGILPTRRTRKCRALYTFAHRLAPSFSLPTLMPSCSDNHPLPSPKRPEAW